MATISAATNEKVFQIKAWAGLHENPDGDTKLKMGEAAAMRNFRITRDGNLQKRPGTKEILTIARNKPVEAMWVGRVNGTEKVLAICDGKLWDCRGLTGWKATQIGSVGTTDHPHMFGFSDKCYILTGNDYMCYDGTNLTSVTGYVPLVQNATPPAGGGVLLEQVNKLNAKRRVWFSPDGTATTFQLPEKDLDSIDSVTLTADGSSLTVSSSDLANGTVTLSTAPAAGANTVEVAYTTKVSYRTDVTKMRFSETYNGTQDTRVFLYGDGSNQAIYSDLDYDGTARADYFPDLNHVRVGIENTPITAMIRHYSKLVAFKTDGAYHIQYGVITTAEEDLAAAFYVTPVNKTIGNVAPGQVQLVLQSPITLFGSDLYEWKNNNSYAANLSVDERQVRRVSDRVFGTLRGMTLANCIAFDDNYNQEYYVSDGSGNTLVWNYAANAWYLYTNFYLHRPFAFEGKLYFGSTLGGIQVVDEFYAYDQYGDGDRTIIPCYWESGSMSFGMDYQRKYSAMLWLGITPQPKASIDVTVRTDRSASLNEKVVSTELFSFGHVNFADFVFYTSRQPKMKRLKIKAKKFVYYKLILKSETDDTTATVVAADFRVRFTGYAK